MSDITSTSAPSAMLVITNGTIIDGTGADPVPDGMLLIQGDRITAVGSRTDFGIYPEAAVIDAQGKTILPGIIDSHVHSAADAGVRRQLLTDGVTALCDLGSPLDSIAQFLQERIGQDPVARGFRAGPILTAQGGLPDAILHENLNYEVATPEEARTAVIDLLDRGVDVIKVYFDPGHESFPMLDKERAHAIVREAHARGILVRAHVARVTVWDLALGSGVDVIEHVPLPPLTEAEIRKQLADSNDPLNDLRTMFRPPEYETLLPRMVAQGTAMAPTLDAGLATLSRLDNPGPEIRIIIDAILQVVRRFRAMGGIIALGSDRDFHNSDFERGMPIREMKFLLAAGLTPMEVIEAGTRHAAHVCGHGGELGALESGKLADVIIVDGDPLADIEVMRKVVTVIKGGKVAYEAEQALSRNQSVVSKSECGC
jgi:imidazolonepropionase-like amidohydrolase